MTTAAPYGGQTAVAISVDDDVKTYGAVGTGTGAVVVASHGGVAIGGPSCEPDVGGSSQAQGYH